MTGGRLSIAARHHAVPRPPRVAAAVGVVLAAGIGPLVPTRPGLAVALVVVIAGLPVLNARPAVLIGLAVAFPWMSRLVSSGTSSARLLDFLDFPLVLLALIVSFTYSETPVRRVVARQRTLARRLAYCGIAILVSWVFRDLGQPQRLVAGFLLAMEPFLLLLAVVVAPITVRERRWLVRLLVALLCGQLPFSLLTMAAGGVADQVQGTLMGTGAGHHVSAGGLALGFFLLVALRARRTTLLVVGGLSLLVVVTADAKQVLFVLPLSLLVLGVTARPSGEVHLLRGLALGLTMALGAMYALLSYQATSTAFDFLERATSNKTGKVAVAQAMWADLGQAPVLLAFGLGPGESVSRFAFLTTPALAKPGSPVRELGIRPSRNAERYDAIAYSGPFTGTSSFTSAQSSALGILGDYGVLGVLTFGSLIVGVVTAVRRQRHNPLRSAALASWTLLLPLAVVFDWLEQPPFTLAVMLITGLSLGPAPGLLRGSDTETRPLVETADVQPES